YRRDWLISSDAVKELQYQLESQRQLLLSKDESVKRLLEALHSKGVPASVAQSCAEMELAQNRIVELEEKCSRLQAHCDDLESHLQQSHDGLSNLRKDAVIESLQDEVASYEGEGNDSGPPPGRSRYLHYRDRPWSVSKNHHTLIWLWRDDD
ncbi:putative ERC protein 2, partial [Trichinella spiralis]|uniref:putative ERC protein 2 n=1 Tax=Trichinella spiralis TaxID=6334 RepID=UPI0001EFDF06